MHASLHGRAGAPPRMLRPFSFMRIEGALGFASLFSAASSSCDGARHAAHTFYQQQRSQSCEAAAAVAGSSSARMQPSAHRDRVELSLASFAPLWLVVRARRVNGRVTAARHTQAPRFSAVWWRRRLPRDIDRQMLST